MRRRLPAVLIQAVCLALVVTFAPAAAQPKGQGAPRSLPGTASGEGDGVGMQSTQNVDLVAQIGGATYAVAAQGNYAYIGVGPRLVILDVSDPARPVVVGQTGALPGVVLGLAVAGSYAYVADRDAGLRVVDVSDPDAPVEIGFYDTPGSASGVALIGSYAYVADGDSGLRVINVSNPAAPVEADSYDTPGFAAGVAVAGSYVYVGDRDGGFLILRFAGAPTPTPTATRTRTATCTPTETLTPTATFTPPTNTPGPSPTWVPGAAPRMFLPVLFREWDGMPVSTATPTPTGMAMPE
jgi:hypothetical protein